ncbi:MAG TPA: toll/interleukin-1 receptor domain-containing protein [Candidatus Eubacterium faecavium]|nr:toll/interleukin-1 receptor domain-containing protein [Candidatus Eubacterium faecavium]
MIFISYNHKDEQLVDMVVRRLELEFGRKNIFYDKWSMQPGDSIIGKMNEGLEKVTTFFYFLSPNSLESDMVKKEWQSALIKSINENVKFVPVRIADCNPPAILTDTLYIDLYGNGIDDAVSQMKCVINSENTYKSIDDIDNLVAIIQQESLYKIKIEIKALLFSENDPDFSFICNNELDDFNIELIGDAMSYNSTGEMAGFNNGIPIKLNMQTRRLFRPLTPTNSMKCILTSKEKPLQFAGIMKVLSNTKGKKIKLETGRVSF